MLPSLPLFTTVLQAYGAVFRHFGAFLRATLIPLLALMLISSIESALPQGGPIKRFVFWLLAAPFWALLVAAWHRIVLLGPDSLTNPWCLYWTSRETGFLGWALLLSAMTWVLITTLGVAGLMAPQSVFGFDTPWLGSALAALITAYVVARFSMVLPATARGKRVILSKSWYLTAGNGVRVMIAIALPELVFLAIFWIVFQLLPDTQYIWLALLMPLFLLTLAVGVAVLSLSYRFLDQSLTDNSA